MKVSLFVPCIINHLMPDSAFSAINVLEKCGVSVGVEKFQVCCGQPAYNMGIYDHAKIFAEKFVRLYEKASCDKIVVLSGSCVSMIKKNYKSLFLGQAPSWLEKVSEFSEFLYSEGLYKKLKLKYRGAVFYHKSCHLLNELEIDKEPKSILSSINGLKIIEAKWHENTCCGFGGAFAATLPDLSIDIGNSKLDFILSKGVNNIIAGDAGCITHLKSLAMACDYKLNFYYMADFLDMCSN